MTICCAMTTIRHVADGGDYPGTVGSVPGIAIVQLEYSGRTLAHTRFANGGRTSYAHDAARRLLGIAHSAGPIR